MKLTQLYFFSFFLLSLSAFSQQSNNKAKSLEHQFDYLYKRSNTYKRFKIIRKTRYQKLKINVLDSIKQYKNNIEKRDKLLKNKIDSIENLKKQIYQLNKDYNVISKENESLSLLGINLKKSVYHLVVWGFIILLLIVLLYFIYKFYNTKKVTKKAEENLLDIEQEFETHRKKSLKKEQELRRKLQDEINKQRGI